LGMHLIAALPWLLNPANWGTVLQVAAGLGFVIFVHELGHFLVAKACGVKCEKFYLGFDIYGLKIVHFQWGETEYGIGILPLGGYVKMLGQDDNPARYSEEARRSQLQTADVAAGSSSSVATAEHAPALTHGDLPPEPVSDPHVPYDPRSYMAQSVPKRMAIISAGVIMNVIFAFIMASIAYAIGVKETPCIVRNVVPGGAAWLAGLEPGDVVKRIGKIENPRFRDLQTGVTLGDLENGVEFEIARPGSVKTFTATLHPDKSLGVPMIGVVGPWTAELADLTEVPPTFKFSPARKAEPKFKAGDKFIKINDVPIKSYEDVQRALVQFVDTPIEVTVQRKPAKKDEASAKEAADAAPVEEKIEVAPTPLRDFGLIMEMGPISAMEPDSIAKANGMLVGDKILEINGKPVGDPLTLPDRMRRIAIAGDTVNIKVSRIMDSGKTEEPTIKLITPIVPKSYDELLPTNPLSVPSLGIAFKVSSKVAAVTPGSPAEEAKIAVGDEITSAKLIPPKPKEDEDPKDAVDAGKIEFGTDPAWPYFVWEVMPFTEPDAKWELEVKSGKDTKKVQLATIELKDDGGQIVHTPARGFIFQPLTIIREANSFGQAVQFGARETRDNLLLVYRFLQKISQKQISVKLLGGPVEIFRQAGRSAQQGFSDFLLFLTMLSANLAVINFLPIPVLDGGHMVFLLYELIRRKPASERVIVAFTYAGLIFILSLMLFVFSLDLGWISRR
jgi:regulator of sigma E protease